MDGRFKDLKVAKLSICYEPEKSGSVTNMHAFRAFVWLNREKLKTQRHHQFSMEWCSAFI